ncbi:hypothetical protein PAP_01260 [Palaeococcus pacificus DY20341]|uniref:ABC transmembrane type-2 domain-containing protein n=1 Tax=Palaeococcus pacificus DY20341 TaxID=1343739 RepID=A0A075LQX0_9EURY|nr:ABC transporter permease [Palaeococcus pacificus]AIF68694.1 hypothetical protein PAP_01260 [Palaeococcus pacificus DY20341]
MKWYRVSAVTKRIFWRLKHDRRMLAFALIAPIIAMTVFGFAFGGEIKDVNIIVVNLDNGHFASEIVKNLDKEIFIIEERSDLQSSINEVKEGRYWAVLYFPDDFSKNVLLGKAAVEVYLDKSNVNVAETIVTGVNKALMDTLIEKGLRFPISIDYSAIYGKEAKFMDMFLPGIMSLAVFMLSTILSVLSFIGERNMGTLERALATPLKEEEVVIGYSIAFGVLGIIQASIMMLVGIFGFNVKITGNPVLAFFIVSLLAVVGVNLGMLLSSVTRSEGQAVQLIPIIILPTFLLAGIFWPIEAIPKYLRPFSYLLPPTYAVDSLRSVIIRGWGIEKVWHDVAVLITFGILFLSLAIFNMKKKQ